MLSVWKCHSNSLSHFRIVFIIVIKWQSLIFIFQADVYAIWHIKCYVCLFVSSNKIHMQIGYFSGYLKCLFFISCICYVMLSFFSLCLSVGRITFVLPELFRNKWFIWQIFSPHDKRFQSQPSSTRRLFCRFVFCHVIFFYSLPSFWMCDYKLWAPYIVGFYRYNDNNSHEFWHGRHFWWRLQGLLFCIS